MLFPRAQCWVHFLFLIYINDLPNSLRSNLKMFADGCILYHEIVKSDDTNVLQSDLDRILGWCITWRMELNINKCKHFRVCCKTPNYPEYSINNGRLKHVSLYKYLGVHITSDLSWRTHLEQNISSAIAFSVTTKCNFYLAPLNLKLTLYKTLFRPKLEYGAAICVPH